MPDRRRFKGRSQFDLIGLLTGIAGYGAGVDVAPDAMQGPATAADNAATGNISINQGAQFKPRSWFSRNTAKDMESQFKLQQIQDNLALQNKLREAEGLSGIKLGEAEKLGAISIAERLNIPPDAKNLEEYNVKGQPLALDSALSKFQSETQANKLSALQSRLQEEAAFNSQQDIRGSLMNKYKLGQMQSSDDISVFPQVSQAKTDMIVNEPIWKEAASVKDSMIPVPGKFSSGLWNSRTGNLSYKGPSMQELTDEVEGDRTGLGTGLAPALPTEQSSGHIQVLTDPTTGKKYRKVIPQ